MPAAHRMKSKAKFTQFMQKTLIDLLKGNVYPHSSVSTMKALVKRGLITEQGTITDEGREFAITFLPLTEQCEQLNLSMYEFVGPYNSEPEYFLWRYFREYSFHAAYCEGGAFLTLIKAAALSILAEINTFNSIDDACTK